MDSAAEYIPVTSNSCMRRCADRKSLNYELQLASRVPNRRRKPFLRCAFPRKYSSFGPDSLATPRHRWHIAHFDGLSGTPLRIGHQNTQTRPILKSLCLLKTRTNPHRSIRNTYLPPILQNAASLDVLSGTLLSNTAQILVGLSGTETPKPLYQSSAFQEHIAKTIAHLRRPIRNAFGLSGTKPRTNGNESLDHRERSFGLSGTPYP